MLTACPRPARPGHGTFDYRTNSTDEIICFDITLCGVTPPFQSGTSDLLHLSGGGRPAPDRPPPHRHLPVIGIYVRGGDGVQGVR
ncbi:MAG: hypothetical protein JWR81_1411 [Pseudonocardia sp.]|nr:hypothetical protein [Pseudonocardia sp.]